MKKPAVKKPAAKKPEGFRWDADARSSAGRRSALPVLDACDATDRAPGGRRSWRVLTGQMAAGRCRILTLAMGAALAGAVFLGGCVSEGVGSGDATEVGSSSDSTDFASIMEAFDPSALDLDYTARELDGSYDEASAVRISLEGDAISADGEGVVVDGATATVTREGTYIVSGALEDGRIVVDAADDQKVQLVLAGATIRNEEGPAIHVKAADKCFVTLAEGSENSLADGEGYALEEGEDEPNATLYSKADLCINGSGSLSVDAAYQHAVNSKDDLVITGGTFDIVAVDDALRGKDCVKIDDGQFAIQAGGDGIKSNNGEDATRGFVSITGGTFDIAAGDDGIQGATYVRVAGGEIVMDATDDALHSDIEALIADGSLEIAAGDDAVHAETLLTIDGGTVNVTSCYEGYEAEKVVVNGGETHIVASDDGINAAAADVTGSDGADAAGLDAGVADDGGAALPGDPKDGFGSGNGADAPDDAPALPDGAEAGAVPGRPAGDPSQGDAVAGAADANGAPELPDDGEPDAPARLDGDMPAAPSDDGSSGDFDGDSGANTPGDAKPDAGMMAGGGGGMDGGMGVANTDCLIEINGGYTVVDAAGDGVDSNGSFAMNGGVLLVCGPTNGGNGGLDYDLEATVSGGTCIVVGAAGMAQNFTSGAQAFAFETVSGQAGQSVALSDGEGRVIASFTPQKVYETVLVSSPSMAENGTYELTIGGEVQGANADGYTDDGSVSGGTSGQITASTTPTGGFGGFGRGGSAPTPDVSGEEGRRSGRMG